MLLAGNERRGRQILAPLVALRLLLLRTGIICIFGGNERRGKQIMAPLVVLLLHSSATSHSLAR